METIKEALTFDDVLLLPRYSSILPSKTDIFTYGCEVTILQLLKLPDGTVKVLVEGNKRVKILDFIDNSYFITCDFNYQNDESGESIEWRDNKVRVNHQGKVLSKRSYLEKRTKFILHYL